MDSKIRLFIQLSLPPKLLLFPTISHQTYFATSLPRLSRFALYIANPCFNRLLTSVYRGLVHLNLRQLQTAPLDLHLQPPAPLHLPNPLDLPI
jgi:hypothetical protein